VKWVSSLPAAEIGAQFGHHRLRGQEVDAINGGEVDTANSLPLSFQIESRQVLVIPSGSLLLAVRLGASFRRA